MACPTVNRAAKSEAGELDSQIDEDLSLGDLEASAYVRTTLVKTRGSAQTYKAVRAPRKEEGLPCNLYILQCKYTRHLIRNSLMYELLSCSHTCASVSTV